MNTIFFFRSLYIFSFFIFCFSGCLGTQGNDGSLQSFSIPNIEAQWIRDGESIEFEGELWYPIDQVESLIDSEVLSLAEYKGVQFFVDKADVRPLARLYTKFGRNQFRVFEKKKK